MWHARQRSEMHEYLWLKNLKEMKHLKDVEVDRIIFLNVD